MARALVLSVLVFLASVGSEAAYLRDMPQELVQPDGSRIAVFASGDEHYHWLHDGDGYVVVRNPKTGYWVWAAKERGAIVPTDFVVGHVTPQLLDLEPNIVPDPDRIRARSHILNVPTASYAPTTGTIENIVVFIRFADDSEFTDTISSYDGEFNDVTGEANSMKAYFEEVSYSQLTIDSTFYPTPPGSTVVSYQDAHPRAYYQPYNSVTNPIGYTSDRTSREHTLLKNAVNAVSSQVPGSLDVDADSDGYVDSVVFIIKGEGDGWSDLLWPHKWALYTQNAFINGARVWEYNFQLSAWLGVGVLCHEMFHTLGAPDLYHYGEEWRYLQPVRNWDLMEYNLNPPQHMLMHMKKRYGGWISSIPEITSSGTYSLNPTTSSTNNAYRIASPNSSTEYFVVEYRKKEGTFEGGIPGTGLLVYRIDSTETGNADGPPDEVYVYRPGGTTTVNGSPDSAHYNLDEGRTQINDSTDPSGFLQDGSPGGLDISDVTSPGATISFTVTLPSDDDFSVSASPDNLEVCRGQDAEYEITVGQIGAFDGPVTLSLSGRPVGSTAEYSPNPVSPTPGTSTLTISTINAELGTSTLLITGTGDPGSHSDTAQLTLVTLPGGTSLQAPSNGATDAELEPSFSWSAVSGATSYTLEIDDDPGFAIPLHSVTAAATSYSGAALDLDTTYYWRVRANNGCGGGTFSSPWSFTTTDGTTQCSNFLLEPGFEGGSGAAWSESSSNGWTIVTSDNPRSGTYSAWLGGDNDEISAAWQSPTIPGEAISATLTYWYSIASNDSCGYDEGGVLIGGSPLAGHTYDLCNDNETVGFVQSAAADLLSYAGSSPQIRFEASTNGSHISNLFIDDVVLEVCVPTAPEGHVFSDGFEDGNTFKW
jgi:M6 family metalloprotease-like protein